VEVSSGDRCSVVEVGLVVAVIFIVVVSLPRGNNTSEIVEMCLGKSFPERVEKAKLKLNLFDSSLLVKRLGNKVNYSAAVIFGSFDLLCTHYLWWDIV
jgi:hypothetical protein